jgi:hypothetical protein
METKYDTDYHNNHTEKVEEHKRVERKDNILFFESPEKILKEEARKPENVRAVLDP